MARRCAWCADRFETCNPRQRTCGRACSVALNRREQDEKTSRRRSLARSRIPGRRCAWCGDKFQPSLAAKTCSQRCRDASYRDSNTAERRAYDRMRYQRDNEIRLALARASYWRNREEILRRNRAAWPARRGRGIANAKAWRAANPEKARALSLAKKARKRAAQCGHGGGCVSAAVIRHVVAQPCMYCGAPAEHVDHFMPIVLGGLHCRENVVPACASCNLRKHAKHPADFLAELAAA